MRLLIGQPDGHALDQRARCGRTARRNPCSARPAACSSASSAWPWNSSPVAHARPPEVAASRQCSRRGYSMKPVGLPIGSTAYPHGSRLLLPADAGEVVGVLLERRHHASSSDRPSSQLAALLRLDAPGGSRSGTPSRTSARSSSQCASTCHGRSLPVYSAWLRISACTSARSPRGPPARRACTISLLQLLREVAVLVVDVGDAARHAGGEVLAGRPEHDHPAAGHVLAAVVADRLHDRVDAAVADAEALAGHAADVRLAAGRAVEGDVADDDVLLGDERRALPAGRR